MFEFIQVQSQSLTLDEELRVYVIACSAGAYLVMSLFCVLAKDKLGIIFCVLMSLFCVGIGYYYYYSQTHHTVDQYRVSDVVVSVVQSQTSIVNPAEQVYIFDLVGNTSYRLVLPAHLLPEEPSQGYQLPEVYCAPSKAYTSDSAQVLECQLSPWQVAPSNEVAR